MTHFGKAKKHVLQKYNKNNLETKKNPSKLTIASQVLASLGSHWWTPTGKQFKGKLGKDQPSPNWPLLQLIGTILCSVH